MSGCLPRLSSACTASLLHGTPGGHKNGCEQQLGDGRCGNGTVHFVSSPPSTGGKLGSKAAPALGYLPAVVRWGVAACQMIVFVALLLPGFLQMVAWFIFSRRIARNVRYGPGSRQQLDLYSPPAASRKVAQSDADKIPVVIYITGGAWIVGYKAWGALLAKRLSQQGVIVASLDYRNFPQARAHQMLEDVNTGIAWVMEHIAEFGGDADNITVIGQSAGAHLGAMALFQQAEQATTSIAHRFAFPQWDPARLRAFVAVSGIYDLPALAEHVQGRGLGRAWVDEVMSINGKPAMDELSPLRLARSWASGTAERLPDIILIHGTADQSAPLEGACQLHQVLKEQSVPCSLQLLEGKGHTCLILEGAMKGGPDLVAEQVLRVAAGHGEVVQHARINPGLLCDWAEWICPF